MRGPTDFVLRRVLATVCVELMAIVALQACGTDTEESDAGTETFDVAKYDRACSASTDCVAVFTGDPCGCSCEMTAIAVSAQSAYDADRAAFVDRNCAEGALQCGACAQTPAVACTAGKCELSP